MNGIAPSDVLNYRGDANLGLASSGGEGLKSYSDIDLTPANNALFNTAYLNMQKNKEAFERNQKRHDEILNMLVNGTVDMKGKLLPNDRQQLMKQRDDIKDYIIQNPDVYNNDEKYIELQNRLANIREGITMGNSRFDQYAEQSKDIAGETNEERRAARQRVLDENIKSDLTQPFKLYQQTLDWDNAKVAMPIPTLQSVNITDEKGNPTEEGLYKNITTRSDLATGLSKYRDAYVAGGKEQTAENVNAFLNSFFGRDGSQSPDQVAQHINAVNGTLDKIAIKEGYDPANQDKLPDYLKHIVAYQADDNAPIQSGSPAWLDWYKTQLSSQYQNANSGPVLDKEAVTLQNNKATQEYNKEKLGLDWFKAKTARQRADVYAKFQNYKMAGNEQETVNNFNSLGSKIEFNRLRGPSADPTKPFEKNLGDVIPANSIPEGFQYIGGVGTNAKGKIIPIKLQPKQGADGQLYYSVDYYDRAGNKLDRSNDAQLLNGYSDARKNGFNGSYEDFIRINIAKGNLMFEIQGKNGSANMMSALQSQKLINAQTKAKDNIYSPENDEEGGSEGSRLTINGSQSDE